MDFDETPIIFVAMFWGGGGPFTISEIIGVYDWINRAIPSRSEMQTSLNYLLAIHLIEKKDDKFLIPNRQYNKFSVFHKKKRKNKFDTARMYFQHLPKVADIPKAVELTEQAYKTCVKEYSGAFEKAWRVLDKKDI